MALMTADSDEEFAASGRGAGGVRPVPRRLPRPRTSFVGREYEIAQARDLLRGNRLLTLTGPGGCGKTRLAIALAAGVTGRFTSGRAFRVAGGDQGSVASAGLDRAEYRVAGCPGPVAAGTPKRLCGGRRCPAGSG